MLHQSRIAPVRAHDDSSSFLGTHCAPDAGLPPPTRSLDQPLCPNRFEDSSRVTGSLTSAVSNVGRARDRYIQAQVHIHARKCYVCERREGTKYMHTSMLVNRLFGSDESPNMYVHSRCWPSFLSALPIDVFPPHRPP